MSCETSLTVAYNVPDDDKEPDATKEDGNASIELSLDEDGNTESPAHFEVDKETGKEVWVEAKIKTTFVFGDTAYLKVLRTDTKTPYEMAKSFGEISFVGSGFSYLQAETIEFSNSKEAELGKEPLDGAVTWAWNGTVPEVGVTFDGKKVTLSGTIKAGILECTYKVQGDRWALKCPYPSKPEITEQPIKVVAIQGKLNASTTVNFVTQEVKDEEDKKEEAENPTDSSQYEIEISLDETMNLSEADASDTSDSDNPNIPSGYKEKTEFDIPDTAYLKVISLAYTEEEWGLAKTNSESVKTDMTMASVKGKIGDYSKKVSETRGVTTKEILYKWTFSDNSSITATFSGALSASEDELKLTKSEADKVSKYTAAPYNMQSGFGGLSMKASGCTYIVREYLTFARETQKKLKYYTENILSWAWHVGNVSVSPQFTGSNITLPSPVIGTLKVEYIIRYDRWSLTVNQAVGELGKAESDGGQKLEVPTVAYQDTVQASVNVPFQKQVSDAPKLKNLFARDCKTGNGIPNAIVVFRGVSYQMGSDGKKNIGLVPLGTYPVQASADGYKATTKEVTVQ